MTIGPNWEKRPADLVAAAHLVARIASAMLRKSASTPARAREARREPSHAPRHSAPQRYRQNCSQGAVGLRERLLVLSQQPLKQQITPLEGQMRSRPEAQGH